MNQKEIILTQLRLLKGMGKSRRQLEIDLGYSEKYIDQCLSRGGNESLLNSLSSYKSKLEKEANGGNLNDEAASYMTPKDIIAALQQLADSREQNIRFLEMELQKLRKENAELKHQLKGNTGGRRHSA